uniref:Uncharacterized protein n=1 Tax=Peronospora matthiolae TaxID=2874970 RepID=A0AAV1VGP4_9STRA
MVEIGDGDREDEGVAVKKDSKVALQTVKMITLFVLSDKGSMYYTVNIWHAMRFELPHGTNVAIIMKSRQLINPIEHTKNRTSMAHLTGVNSYIASQYVRLLTAQSAAHRRPT